MLTDEQRQLFTEPNLAHIATVMPDGSPQVTPVWIELDPDGERIIVNSALGRVKSNNVERDPRVALSVVSNADPYTMVAVRGIVEEYTTEGGDEGIDRLATKYLGVERYAWKAPGETRVVMKIRPVSVSGG